MLVPTQHRAIGILETNLNLQEYINKNISGFLCSIGKLKLV